MLRSFRRSLSRAGLSWRTGKPATANSKAGRTHRPVFEALERRMLLAAGPGFGGPVISELMAINNNGLQDFEGDRPDWLEIHNPGIASVDLTGWSLRDSNDQWVFPAMSLGPGEFRVIFASDKDLRDPAGELHTNFKLSGSGEYLGLLDDAGVVVHQYDPFPQQTADVSYGIAQDIEKTDYVASGDTARYLVPPNGNQGDWTAVGFDDGTWGTGGTALGFADTVEGLAVWNYKASVTVGNLDVASDVIDTPGMQSSVWSENRNVINYYNSGGRGNFTANEVDFPGLIGDTEDFVVEATGMVTIPSAGQWTFGVNSDDGFGLTIPGATTTLVTNSSTPAGSDTISFFDPRGPGDTLGVYNFPVAGVYNVQLVFFERAGGAGLELFAAQGSHTGFSGAFDLVGDTAAGGLEVFSEPVGGGGGGGGSGLASLIETDVEDIMKDVNASIYTRIPFTVEYPELVQSLTLKMKYDDGYVAYLNGQEIARQNAPASPSFNSSATADRTDPQATTWENVDATAYRGLLSSDNVLAIHGLNYTAGNGDFLVLPELTEILYLGLGEHFFAIPTPGDVNTEEYWLQVEDTRFSHDRGFYETPFDLTIATDTPGAAIYYTTDGSAPTETNGTLYSGPIHVTTTTIVRAAAYKNLYAPTNVDTQTYLFLDDVINQPSNPAGFPASWGGTTADYEMDPNIIGDPFYADTLKDDLMSLPTMSLVMDVEDVFGSGGIYANPNNQGTAWERPASLEYFDPSTSEEFQVNAGARMYGGVGRNAQYMKHSFRILFKGDYGPTKLRFPLFGDGAVDEFDTIILRSNFNDAWVWGGAATQFVRDEFIARLQNAMGDGGRHGDFVHLYINGLYWGLYNPVERPDTSFSASYYGGDKDNWDGINSGNPTGESQRTAWDTLMNMSGGLAANTEYQRVQGNNLDGTNNPAYEDYLDVDQYINFLLANQFGGNNDWGSHNWYAGRMRGPDSTGWKAYSWDAEWVINMHSGLNDNTVNDTTTSNWLLKPYTYLRNNAEFRLRYADQVHKLFFNGGALTPEYTGALYQSLTDLIEQSVKGETARWGDVRGHEPPYDLDDWTNERNYLLNTYLPQRPNIVLGQLKSANLYPNIVAPSFRLGGSPQHGGGISLGDSLTITAPAGTIYYTTDGTDPRQLYGAVAPGVPIYSGAIALNQSTHVKSRVYTGGQWSALNEATFYIDLTPNIRITEIMYNPADPTPDEVLQGFTDNNLFEFVEIQNISPPLLEGGSTMPLQWLRFSDGIDFTFPNVSVAPGDYVVVVKDQAAFEYRYDTFAGTIAGEYGGWLRNSGERVVLDAPQGGIVHDFSYDDDWYGHTDGEGFSLTIRDPEGDRGLWNVEEGWRASAALGGTPGYGDTLVDPGSVVITEVLAHSDDPFVDMIELYNTSSLPVDVSGWFLSDQKTDELGNDLLTKYEIPALPAIGPGQYLVLREDTHFGGAFGISELGDDVYLSSNVGGTAGGYREHVDFGASPRNVSIGLHTKSTGGTDFTLLGAHSFAAPNAYPYLEDLVINEVMYHPAYPSDDEIAAGFTDDDQFEFVEIYNASADTAYTLSDYYLGNGIGFTFGWYDADAAGKESWTLEPGATATWDTSLPAGLASYEVFARWDLLDAEGDVRELDGQARYTVTHDGGSTTVIRDQEPEPTSRRQYDEGPGYIDTDGWVSLGTYDFDGSGRVVLARGTDNPGNWTIADQVKFVSTTHEELVDAPALDSRYTANGPATIGPGEYVVVVRDYAAFDERYDIAAGSIPVAGEYTGKLSNGGEKVKLFRLGDAEPNGYLPYYRIDYVNYDDVSPWPMEADGQGPALNRVGADQYGNDAGNWALSSTGGTPGSLNDYIDPTPPTVPGNLAAHVTVGPDTVSLSWDASLDPQTFVDHYIIYRDDELLGISSTNSYDDADVSPAVFHTYQLSAVNRDGYESELTDPVVVAVPGIVSHSVPDTRHIEINFTEPLDPATAEVLGNYVFTGGTLSGVALGGGGLTVILTTSEAMVSENPYSVTVNGVTTVSGNEMADGHYIAFVYAPRGAGFILREFWTGIGGTAVADLTNNPNYPDNPSGESNPTLFEGPIDWADNYGTRIHGYVHPPVSGDYTFWVSGDDNCELYLSTDTNPDNAVLIASVPEWTNSREWTRFGQQESTPIPLLAGQRYYILALQKELGGGDSIAVRWQLPDGSWENPADPNEPIPGERLSPYVENPRPVAGSDSYEVIEGDTLSVAAPGVLVNDYDPMPGPASLTAELVTGASHAATFNLDGDGSVEYTPTAGYKGPDSFTYRVFDGLEYSQTATVGINVVDAVRILSAEATDNTHVEVLFSTPLDETSAEEVGNYLVIGGLTVQSATLGVLPGQQGLRTVTLLLSPAMTDNLEYTLRVRNVQDATLAHVIVTNTQVTFQHVSWLGQDIGAVGAAGSHSEQDGVWTIEGSGNDIWGAADEFHYVYQPISGDATITARVTSVENTNTWAKVGVMFRETLTSDSTHAMTVVTRGQGVSFQRRRSTGAGSEHTTDAGLGAPYWVRMVRQGNTLNSYRSADGNNWVQMGSITIAMAPSIYVGLAVTSHNDGVLCTGVFDNLSLVLPDVAPPTADIIDVTPDPRTAAVGQIQIVFSEAVTGLNVGDLRLTRDGGGNLLTAESVTTTNNIAWTLGGLTGLTAVPGSYTLTLTATASGIQDAAGNLLQANVSDSWVVESDNQVEARHIFYNQSAFDGNNAAAGVEDDDAIASDKQALLPGTPSPGNTASFANYTSYIRGINGIMIDITEVPGVLTAGDFIFKVGNSFTPDAWGRIADQGGPDPTVSIRPDAGENGSDRVTLIWPSNVIQKQWLQVTVLANARTGLAQPDVFYFGNAIGEMGNSTTDAKVNAIDMLGARDNQRNFFNPAPVDFAYDFNRDQRVNSTDMLIARNNQSHFLNALKLITVPAAKAAAVKMAGRIAGKGGAAEIEDAALFDAVLAPAEGQDVVTPQRPSATLAWLHELVQTTAHQRPSEKDESGQGSRNLMLDSDLP